MTQQTKLQKGTAPEVCKAEGPELILDLCSPLAESPLPHDWMPFDMFSIGLSPFSCSPEYTSEQLASQERRWSFLFLFLSLTVFKLQGSSSSLTDRKVQWELIYKACSYDWSNFVLKHIKEKIYTYNLETFKQKTL